MILMLSVFFLTLGISLWAAWRVKAVYKRYLEVGTFTGFTGAEVAHQMLKDAGINDVEVVSQPGFLGDHMTPSTSASSFPRTTMRGAPWRQSASRLTKRVTPCNMPRALPLFNGGWPLSARRISPAPS